VRSLRVRVHRAAAAAIASMGDKSVARETVQKAGAPIMPGSDGPVASADDARKVAQAIGFPVIVKASAGGGGRGMRVARSPDELEQTVATAQAEAGDTRTPAVRGQAVCGLQWLPRGWRSSSH